MSFITYSYLIWILSKNNINFLYLIKIFLKNNIFFFNSLNFGWLCHVVKLLTRCWISLRDYYWLIQRMRYMLLVSISNIPKRLKIPPKIAPSSHLLRLVERAQWLILQTGGKSEVCRNQGIQPTRYATCTSRWKDEIDSQICYGPR